MDTKNDKSLPLPVYGLVNISEWNVTNTNVKFLKLPEVLVEFIKEKKYGIKLNPSDNVPLLLQKVAAKLKFEDYKCIISEAQFCHKIKEALAESRKLLPESILRNHVLTYVQSPAVHPHLSA